MSEKEKRTMASSSSSRATKRQRPEPYSGYNASPTPPTADEASAAAASPSLPRSSESSSSSPAVGPHISRSTAPLAAGPTSFSPSISHIARFAYLAEIQRLRKDMLETKRRYQAKRTELQDERQAHEHTRQSLRQAEAQTQGLTAQLREVQHKLNKCKRGFIRYREEAHASR